MNNFNLSFEFGTENIGYFADRKLLRSGFNIRIFRLINLAGPWQYENYARFFVLDRYFTINIYHDITALKVKYGLLVPVLFIRIINNLRRVQSYMSIRPHSVT